MKYNELKIGDYFTINRENNENVYKKFESYFTLCGTRLSFRKLNGGTQVRKVIK